MLLSEKRLKRKILTQYIVIAFLIVALVVFVSLFVTEYEAKTKQYKEIYMSTMTNCVSLMSRCIATDFDYEKNYNETTAELNVACEMLYLSNANNDKLVCINELYSAFLRLPNQMKKHMETIYQGVMHISEGREEQGYAILKSVLEVIDRNDI